MALMTSRERARGLCVAETEKVICGKGERVQRTTSLTGSRLPMRTMIALRTRICCNMHPPARYRRHSAPCASRTRRLGSNLGPNRAHRASNKELAATQVIVGSIREKNLPLTSAIEDPRRLERAVVTVRSVSSGLVPLVSFRISGESEDGPQITASLY